MCKAGKQLMSCYKNSCTTARNNVIVDQLSCSGVLDPSPVDPLSTENKLNDRFQTNTEILLTLKLIILFAIKNHCMHHFMTANAFQAYNPLMYVAGFHVVLRYLEMIVATEAINIINTSKAAARKSDN